MAAFIEAGLQLVSIFLELLIPEVLLKIFLDIGGERCFYYMHVDTTVHPCLSEVSDHNISLLLQVQCS